MSDSRLFAAIQRELRRLCVTTIPGQEGLDVVAVWRGIVEIADGTESGYADGAEFLAALTYLKKRNESWEDVWGAWNRVTHWDHEDLFIYDIVEQTVDAYVVAQGSDGVDGLCCVSLWREGQKWKATAPHKLCFEGTSRWWHDETIPNDAEDIWFPIRLYYEEHEIDITMDDAGNYLVDDGNGSKLTLTRPDLVRHIHENWGSSPCEEEWTDILKYHIEGKGEEQREVANTNAPR